ncbi:MAG TPA: pyrroline-5-carboxylate reductase [Candidatus Omnitrophota bacterium]|nr:pyrroline-5-carboxylate reductase [Candidatus Omnitrophota bacterium]HPS37458.1 pyrroline-5-carboxylate reductase [Candidatus Omnitrophota bacterium]
MKRLGKWKIGLIGVGNMGTSILEGVLRKGIASPSQIWVYDKIVAKARGFARKTRVHCAASAVELLDKSDVVMLAQKPQDFAPFAAEHKYFFRPGHCVISILAGLTTERIREAFGGKAEVVRAMPNLGAKVGESMTAVCGKNKKWIAFAENLFSGCGAVVRLPEKSFDLVTAVSGSGPAYFFHLMELMADFGVMQGLPANVAATLAVQTGLGAALLAKGSEHSCAELREKVTSKKGTTDAALKVLKQKKFGRIFHRALAAAMVRSRQLRKK